MCILFGTRAHPDYKLILISNRDEFFERKTHVTCWNHDNYILSPYDMAIEKKGYDYGTWLGINKKGKVAVILNLKMDPILSKPPSPLKESRSRGIVPLHFLDQEDDTPFEDWNSWEKFNSSHHDLDKTGPFTLFYGDANTGHYNVIDFLRHSVDPFAINGHMVISNDVFYCSKGKHNDRWDKTKYGYDLLQALTKNTVGISKESLFRKCFELASNHHYNEGEDVNTVTMKNVLVPPLRVPEVESIGTSLPIGDYYGTRSQIVILVDNNNHVSYEEHVLYESDNDCEFYSYLNPKKKLRFEFDIED